MDFPSLSDASHVFPIQDDSPSSPILPRSRTSSTASSSSTSPTRDLHRNNHPYGIKTTSTGILTRSNSSGYNAPLASHSYSPLVSPSAPQPRTHKSTASQSGKRDLSYESGHRMTKSLSSDTNGEPFGPPPLPLPDGSESSSSRSSSRSLRHVSFSEDEEYHSTFGSSPFSVNDSHTTRSTIRPLASRASIAHTGVLTPNTAPSSSTAFSDIDAIEIKGLGLPENPRAWTPIHLSAYLGVKLSSGHGETLADHVIDDIQAFILRENLTGRVFLRLTTYDMDRLGINLDWRAALLAQAQALRHKMVKGRIYGFGSPNSSSPSASVYSQEDTIHSNDSTPSKSSVPRSFRPPLRVRHTSLGGDGTSTESGWIGRAMLPKHQQSSFDTSKSFQALPSSQASSPLNTPSQIPPIRRATSASGLSSGSGAHVKEMIESWEHASASEGSTSASESEGRYLPYPRVHRRRKRASVVREEEGELEYQGTHDAAKSETESDEKFFSAGDVSDGAPLPASHTFKAINADVPLATPKADEDNVHIPDRASSPGAVSSYSYTSQSPPPYTSDTSHPASPLSSPLKLHTQSSSSMLSTLFDPSPEVPQAPVHDDEPSIEELLDDDDSFHHPWEDDAMIGDTVKRIPPANPSPHQTPFIPTPLSPVNDGESESSIEVSSGFVTAVEDAASSTSFITASEGSATPSATPSSSALESDELSMEDLLADEEDGEWSHPWEDEDVFLGAATAKKIPKAKMDMLPAFDAPSISSHSSSSTSIPSMHSGEPSFSVSRRTGRNMLATLSRTMSETSTASASTAVSEASSSGSGPTRLMSMFEGHPDVEESIEKVEVEAEKETEAEADVESETEIEALPATESSLWPLTPPEVDETPTYRDEDTHEPQDAQDGVGALSDTDNHETIPVVPIYPSTIESSTLKSSTDEYTDAVNKTPAPSAAELISTSNGPADAAGLTPDLMTTTTPRETLSPPSHMEPSDELNNLRLRVVELERKITQLEEREAGFATAAEEERLRLDQAFMEEAANAAAREAAEVEAELEARTKRERSVDDDGLPLPGSLPYYILAVGLGVAIVVVQTLAKRYYTVRRE